MKNNKNLFMMMLVAQMLLGKTGMYAAGQQIEDPDFKELSDIDIINKEEQRFNLSAGTAMATVSAAHLNNQLQLVDDQPTLNIASNLSLLNTGMQLFAYRVNTDFLHDVQLNNETAVKEWLSRKRYKSVIRDSVIRYALQHAASNGHEEIVTAILKAYPDHVKV